MNCVNFSSFFLFCLQFYFEFDFFSLFVLINSLAFLKFWKMCQFFNCSNFVWFHTISMIFQQRSLYFIFVSITIQWLWVHANNVNKETARFIWHQNIRNSFGSSIVLLPARKIRPVCSTVRLFLHKLTNA